MWILLALLAALDWNIQLATTYPLLFFKGSGVYMAFPDLCVEVGVTCYLGFLLLGDRLLLCSPDWP